MTSLHRARPRLALAALALLVGCGASTRAVLRVDPPPDAPGAVAGTEQLALERAVRDVAASERLECWPGAAELLSCRSVQAGWGSSATIEVVRSGSGYLVTTSAPRSPAAAAEDVCRVQRRLQEAIDVAVGGPATHPVAGGPCPASR